MGRASLRCRGGGDEEFDVNGESDSMGGELGERERGWEKILERKGEGGAYQGQNHDGQAANEEEERVRQVNTEWQKAARTSLKNVRRDKERAMAEAEEKFLGIVMLNTRTPTPTHTHARTHTRVILYYAAYLTWQYMPDISCLAIHRDENEGP